MSEAAVIRTPNAPIPAAADLTAEDARRLVQAVQGLSLAHDLQAVMRVVRVSARELVNADGVTFVLREDEYCFYADEYAIAPLWKGRRFPASACVSGWSMRHREAVAIEDIFADPRVPADAYRPTFVKSLAMVPVRREDPIAAIGAYWATRRMPTPREVALLQLLADATAVAIANTDLFRELERHSAALRRMEERLRLAVDAGELGTWDYNPVTGEMIWDARCKAAYGVAPEAPVDYAVFRAGLHPEDRDGVEQAVADAIAGRDGGLFEREYRTVGRDDGRERWVSVRGRALFDATGRAARFVGITQDVSARKATERALQDAVRLRDEFLAIAGHELKTPLAALQLQVQGLRRLLDSGRAEPARVGERLARASGQIERFGRLVEEMLDLSRTFAGGVRLEPEPTDLRELLEEIVRRFEEPAARARCALVRRIDGAGAGAPGWFDRLRIDQAVSNLLDNALKYGSGKPVEVALAVKKGRALIEVRDQGIGIAPELHGRIFERFGRGVSERHYGGFGLGLWMARQVVEASGGSIAVASEPGAGSTFTISLPLCEDARGGSRSDR